MVKSVNSNVKERHNVELRESYFIPMMSCRRRCPGALYFFPSFDFLRTYEPSGSLSKYFFVLCAESSMARGGMPSTSTILLIWSTSFAPENSGSPVCISTKMQPSDHMSIAKSYGMPSSTSGDR